MDLNIILLVLATLTGTIVGQSYGRYRYGRRTRTNSRLFGGSYSSSNRRNYDYRRKPASVPFTLPGFGSSPSSPSNVFKTLGFNLGFGGRAFADPIAGFYETKTSNIGDGGGQNSPSGFRDITNDFNSLNTAANSRSSFSRESNAALDPSVYNTRRQNVDTNNAYANSRGLGFQNLNLGSNQYLSSVNAGSLAGLDLTSAVNPRMELTSFRSQLGSNLPTQNSLNANLLNGLGSVQYIDTTGLGNGATLGLDLSNAAVSDGGIQTSLNSLGIASNHLLNGHDHSLVTGHQGLQGISQLGIDTNQLGMEASSLGIDSNQLGLAGNPLGLGSKQLDLGQNKIMLGGSNSLGLDANHYIINSEQTDMHNLGASNLGGENQLILGTSAGDMSILGNQLGLGNNEQLLASNQIGSDLGQLSSGHLDGTASLQGQMLGMGPKMTGDSGSQFLTSSGGFQATSLGSQALNAQTMLGSTDQFYSPKEEGSINNQPQKSPVPASMPLPQPTPQLTSGLLAQMNTAV